MSTFLYWSCVFVASVMLIRYAWDAVKLAFKIWFNLIFLLLVGLVLVFVVFPLVLSFVFNHLLY
jgi:hypothetical protein